MQTTTDPSETGTRVQLRQPVTGLPDPGERVPSMAWPTGVLYVGTLGLFALGMAGYFVWDWSLWLTVPIGAAVTFLMFSVLHESTHHAISSNTRVNNLFGHLSVPFVVAWSTYPLVKFIHIEHHRNTNEPKSIDPDAWCDEGPKVLLPLRWMTIDIWYVVFYMRRLKDRPSKEVVTTFTLFTAVWGLFGTIIALGGGVDLLLALLVPNRFGVMVLAWWFDYLPHHGLTKTQREDKYQATRVRVGGESVLTPLFVYQNYHLVHHLHPSIPFYRYIVAWKRNEEAYLDRNAAISTWFGRSLTTSEYRTWRRLTDKLELATPGTAERPVFHPLRVKSVEPITSESMAVTFDVPPDLAHRYRYLQGQHITLRAVINGREERRSYSLIEPVSANTLRVGVKQIPNGVFSTYVNNQLAAGDILDVMTPTGIFNVRLDKDFEHHHVALAAGSGVTPMMSTIATTLETEPKSRFTLIYGNRTTESTMFRDRLDALQEQYGGRLTVHHVLSDELGGGLTGQITPELVKELIKDPRGVYAWFLCGPQAMIDTMRTALGNMTDLSRVLSEVFFVVDSGPGVSVDVDIESEVVVALDGVETSLRVHSQGDTILDAALQAGIDPPYSCAGGACGTCKAKVLLGKAVMDQNHVLDETEVEDGFILTCQAHPVTQEVRIDYDA
ncbi:fatty acid desaturase [Nocardioides caeni]|nr:fatty acid desaturase [Nocardioides caeni]